MNKKVFISIAFMMLTSWGVSAAYNPEVSVPKIVDFRLYYPLVNFSKSGYDIYQKNFLGLSLAYQFFCFGPVGIFFEPSLFTIPIRQNGVKKKLFSVGMSGGLAFRFLPTSYFDPVIQGAFGTALFDAAEFESKAFSYPLSSRASINLYSTRDRFDDMSLALAATGGLAYYVSAYTILKPIIVDFGLALRGSF